MHIPNKLTRVIYAISLLLIAMPFVMQKSIYAFRLFEQMGRNPNDLNPIIAILYLLMTTVIAAIVLHRIYELLRGKLTLSSPEAHRIIKVIRNIGIFFMYFGIAVVIVGLVYGLISRVGSKGLIVSYFKPSIPIGFLIFEFSRIKSQELYLAAK